MNELIIRPAAENDLPEMQALARKTISHSFRSFLGDENVDGFINSGSSDNEIASHLQHCEVLVKEGQIAGFTIYFDNIIHLMMVDAELHRQGLGSVLLAHAEEQLFKLGNTIIRLETFEDNRQAMNFYRKFGWKETKKEKDKETGICRVFFEKFAN